MFLTHRVRCSAFMLPRRVSIAMTRLNMFFFLLSPFGTVVINRRTLNTSYLPSADTFFMALNDIRFCAFKPLDGIESNGAERAWEIRFDFSGSLISCTKVHGIHTTHTHTGAYVSEVWEKEKEFSLFSSFSFLLLCWPPVPSSICNKHATTTA